MSREINPIDLLPQLQASCLLDWVAPKPLFSIGPLTFRLAQVRFVDIPKISLCLLEVGPIELINNEIQFHQVVHHTALSSRTPRLVNRPRLSDSETGMIIYELPASSSEHVLTLAGLLKEEYINFNLLSQVTAEIARGLLEWNSVGIENHDSYERGNLQQLLTKSLGIQIGDKSDWRDLVRHADLTDGIQDGVTTLLFENCMHLLPNPLAYLVNERIGTSEAVFAVPIGHQLGQLDVKSTIINTQSQMSLFVKFSLYQRNNVFNDWFNFEFGLIRNYINVNTYRGWNEFLQLTEEITMNVDLPSSPPSGLGERATLAWNFLYPARHQLFLAAEKITEEGLKKQLRDAMWISATVSGLQTAISRDEELSVVERRAALFYAANALSRLLPHNARGELTVPAGVTGNVRWGTQQRKVSAPALKEYIQWVADEGGATGHRISGLEEWFVDPDAQFKPSPRVRHYDDDEWLTGLEQQWGTNAQPEKREYLGGYKELQKYLKDYHRVVLLGEPGVGKTTLLERLFLKYSEGITDTESAIPVLVRLQSFRGEQSFEDFILDQLGHLRPSYNDVKSRLIILCDALNEMPHQSYGEDKRDLIEEVRQFLENTTIPWILSCRVRDYVSHNLSRVGRGVRRVEIMPLNFVQIREVIQRRFRNVPSLAVRLWDELCGGRERALVLEEVWQKFQKHNEELRFWDSHSTHAKLRLSSVPNYINTDIQIDTWASMHDRKLLPLCRNPYMLKLIAQLYFNNANQNFALPTSQGQLFHRVTTTLINRALESVGESGSVDKASLPDLHKQIVKALQVLAFTMQAHQKTRQTETEIARRDGFLALSKADVIQPERVIELAQDAQILLIDDSKIRFSHQLMQEYFASITLVEALQDTDPLLYWPAERWWEPSKLDETAIILVGWYQDWESVVKWIAKANPELAAECLIRNDKAAKDLSADTHVFIADSIQSKIQDARSVFERGAAYRAFGWFGDTRAGVAVSSPTLPDIKWSDPIPKGIVNMGGDPEALNSWEGIAREVSYTYYVSQYPVTVAQYRCFIQDGGYTAKWKHCWSVNGWEWLNRERKTCPYAWNRSRWTVPNHPVIGVTWYECFAYSNWLSIRLAEVDQIPGDNLVIRLPTEAEWERAARGDTTNSYPWGIDSSNHYANVKGTSEYLGRTSAVGLFGPKSTSPFGVYDMAGNVWEWCLSIWSEKYQSEEIVDPNLEGARSSRGGSWYHNLKNARAASRFWYHPNVADFCWGFRVCASIKLY